ncbi:MAG TPA: GAF domain-containing protein [Candidatus Udaeobacter sp.]|nr:GAF domain-containing protein [Candidatus Udaeobacter sp.]
MESQPEGGDGRRELALLHAMSADIARLDHLPQVLDHALGYCIELTGSKFGFIGLVDRERQTMDVAAIKGLGHVDAEFYRKFHFMVLRDSVVGVVARDGQPRISNDVLHDPLSVGQPRGHPPVRTFCGAPLAIGERVIGMVGVANRPGGYSSDHEELLGTFANQAAVAVDNAQLYDRQREMIERLRELNREQVEAARTRAVEEERNRIAAGLHDQIEQALFAIGIRLRSVLESESLTESTRRQLDETRDILARAAEATHGIVFASSPWTMTVGDLAGALMALSRQIARDLGLDVEVIVSGDAPSLDASSEAVLWRVAHSSLLNVVRHAHASSALVTLEYGPDQVTLSVQDDGSGAPAEVIEGYGTDERHFGLRSMAHQVEETGGAFEVANLEQGGMIVRATVPVQRS